MPIVQFQSRESLLQTAFEAFINLNAGAVSKVADTSVIMGILQGAAANAQFTMAELSFLQSQFLPEDAAGQYLDAAAERLGLGPRFLSSQSSTYIRIFADPGTIYTAGVQTFSGANGVTFDLESTTTIPASGYTYAKIRSQTTGVQANVPAQSINRVAPEPTGHLACINEVAAAGGRDFESDLDFRTRILNGGNFAATNTLAKIEQALIKSNPNVLQARFQGMDAAGRSVIALVSQNGIDFSPSELNQMLSDISGMLSISDYKPDGTNTIGIILKNVTWFPVDISFRCELETAANPDFVMAAIMSKNQKLFDYRTWQAGSKVQWDDLLLNVKTTPGVKYVFDTTFFPNQDLPVPVSSLPRMRGFLMLDKNGAIIRSVSGLLNPFFYPSVPDFAFQQSNLRSNTTGHFLLCRAGRVFGTPQDSSVFLV